MYDRCNYANALSTPSTRLFQVFRPLLQTLHLSHVGRRNGEWNLHSPHFEDRQLGTCNFVNGRVTQLARLGIGEVFGHRLNDRYGLVFPFRSRSRIFRVFDTRARWILCLDQRSEQAFGSSGSTGNSTARGFDADGFRASVAARRMPQQCTAPSKFGT